MSSLEKHKDYLFMITGEKIHFLCGAFNSNLYKFYLGLLLSGNNYTYGSREFFQTVPIIIENNELVDKIEKMVIKISQDYNENLISEINRTMYKLYSLSIEEIDYIENSR